MAPAPRSAPLPIVVVSDVVCPWCYIGKRRLERALAARPQPTLTVRWRAFQLNPGMPKGGMDRQGYLEAKFGGADRAARIYDTIRTVGASEGIEFAFHRIRRTPNTLDAHRLLRFAAGVGRQSETAEGLFQAYFQRGEDIGDRDTLAEIAAEAGLDADAARTLLASDREAQSALAEDMLARRQGINGVPCFVFNGRFALSGAQEPEALFQLFDLAREDDATQERAAAGV
jgi:predicted DsbA family dithiol-disulfide isomerase